MTTHPSIHPEWKPLGPSTGLRGVVAVSSLAFLLAACGGGSGTPQAPATTGTHPAASATAKRPAATPATAPATASTPAPAATANAAQPGQAGAAGTTSAKLQSMSVPDLLAAARDAYAQHRLVAPAGDNAMEYYEAVLAKDPGNQVAKDALREAFPFGVPDVEKAISQGNFDDASRAIDLLAKADPTNYTLTLLRSKLDAQKRLQTRQEQQQLAEQQAAQQAAAQQAAAEQAAAAKAAADREAAAKLAAQRAAERTAQQQAAAAKPEPPKPSGETRSAKVITPAAPSYPLQAARNQTSGYAVVEFTVSAQGIVENPRVVDSSPRNVFNDAAIQAVRNSKFEPALKDGEPVSSVLQRRINFNFGG